MCNASLGIRNEAMNEGIEKGKIEIYYTEMKLSVREISRKLSVEEKKVREIIREMGW